MKVLRIEIGGVAEWLKAADCKSARASVRWFESSPVHHRHFHSRVEVQGALGPFLRAGLSGDILQFFDHIDPDLAPR